MKSYFKLKTLASNSSYNSLSVIEESENKNNKHKSLIKMTNKLKPHIEQNSFEELEASLIEEKSEINYSEVSSASNKDEKYPINNFVNKNINKNSENESYSHTITNSNLRLIKNKETRSDVNNTNKTNNTNSNSNSSNYNNNSNNISLNENQRKRSLFINSANKSRNNLKNKEINNKRKMVRMNTLTYSSSYRNKFQSSLKENLSDPNIATSNNNNNDTSNTNIPSSPKTNKTEFTKTLLRSNTKSKLIRKTTINTSPYRNSRKSSNSNFNMSINNNNNNEDTHLAKILSKQFKTEIGKIRESVANKALRRTKAMNNIDGSELITQSINTLEFIEILKKREKKHFETLLAKKYFKTVFKNISDYIFNVFIIPLNVTLRKKYNGNVIYNTNNTNYSSIPNNITNGVKRKSLISNTNIASGLTNSNNSNNNNNNNNNNNKKVGFSYGNSIICSGKNLLNFNTKNNNINNATNTNTNLNENINVNNISLHNDGNKKLTTFESNYESKERSGERDKDNETVLNSRTKLIEIPSNLSNHHENKNSKNSSTTNSYFNTGPLINFSNQENSNINKIVSNNNNNYQTIQQGSNYAHNLITNKVNNNTNTNNDLNPIFLKTHDYLYQKAFSPSKNINYKMQENLFNVIMNLKYSKIPKNFKIFNIGEKAEETYYILSGNVAIIVPILITIEITQEEYLHYLNTLLNNKELSLYVKVLEINLGVFDIDYDYMRALRKKHRLYKKFLSDEECVVLHNVFNPNYRRKNKREEEDDNKKNNISDYNNRKNEENCQDNNDMKLTSEYTGPFNTANINNNIDQNANASKKLSKKDDYKIKLLRGEKIPVYEDNIDSFACKKRVFRLKKRGRDEKNEECNTTRHYSGNVKKNNYAVDHYYNNNQKSLIINENEAEVKRAYSNRNSNKTKINLITIEGDDEKRNVNLIDNFNYISNIDSDKSVVNKKDNEEYFNSSLRDSLNKESKNNSLNLYQFKDSKVNSNNNGNKCNSSNNENYLKTKDTEICKSSFFSSLNNNTKDLNIQINDNNSNININRNNINSNASNDASSNKRKKNIVKNSNIGNNNISNSNENSSIMLNSTSLPKNSYKKFLGNFSPLKRQINSIDKSENRRNSSISNTSNQKSFNSIKKLNISNNNLTSSNNNTSSMKVRFSFLSPTKSKVKSKESNNNVNIITSKISSSKLALNTNTNKASPSKVSVIRTNLNNNNNINTLQTSSSKKNFFLNIVNKQKLQTQSTLLNLKKDSSKQKLRYSTIHDTKEEEELENEKEHIDDDSDSCLSNDSTLETKIYIKYFINNTIHDYIDQEISPWSIKTLKNKNSSISNDKCDINSNNNGNSASYRNKRKKVKIFKYFLTSILKAGDSFGELLITENQDNKSKVHSHTETNANTVNDKDKDKDSYDNHSKNQNSNFSSLTDLLKNYQNKEKNLKSKYIKENKIVLRNYTAVALSTTDICSLNRESYLKNLNQYDVKTQKFKLTSLLQFDLLKRFELKTITKYSSMFVLKQCEKEYDNVEFLSEMEYVERCSGKNEIYDYDYNYNDYFSSNQDGSCNCVCKSRDKNGASGKTLCESCCSRKKAFCSSDALKSLESKVDSLETPSKETNNCNSNDGKDNYINNSKLVLRNDDRYDIRNSTIKETQNLTIKLNELLIKNYNEKKEKEMSKNKSLILIDNYKTNDLYNNTSNKQNSNTTISNKNTILSNKEKSSTSIVNIYKKELNYNDKNKDIYLKGFELDSYFDLIFNNEDKIASNLSKYRNLLQHGSVYELWIKNSSIFNIDRNIKLRIDNYNKKKKKTITNNQNKSNDINNTSNIKDLSQSHNIIATLEKEEAKKKKKIINVKQYDKNLFSTNTIHNKTNNKNFNSNSIFSSLSNNANINSNCNRMIVSRELNQFEINYYNLNTIKTGLNSNSKPNHSNEFNKYSTISHTNNKDLFPFTLKLSSLNFEKPSQTIINKIKENKELLDQTEKIQEELLFQKYIQLKNKFFYFKNNIVIFITQGTFSLSFKKKSFSEIFLQMKNYLNNSLFSRYYNDSNKEIIDEIEDVFWKLNEEPFSDEFLKQKRDVSISFHEKNEILGLEKCFFGLDLDFTCVSATGEFFYIKNSQLMSLIEYDASVKHDLVKLLSYKENAVFGRVRDCFFEEMKAWKSKGFCSIIRNNMFSGIKNFGVDKTENNNNNICEMMNKNNNNNRCSVFNTVSNYNSNITPININRNKAINIDDKNSCVNIRKKFNTINQISQIKAINRKTPLAIITKETNFNKDKDHYSSIIQKQHLLHYPYNAICNEKINHFSAHKVRVLGNRKVTLINNNYNIASFNLQNYYDLNTRKNFNSTLSSNLKTKSLSKNNIKRINIKVNSNHSSLSIFHNKLKSSTMSNNKLYFNNSNNSYYNYSNKKEERVNKTEISINNNIKVNCNNICPNNIKISNFDKEEKSIEERNSSNNSNNNKDEYLIHNIKKNTLSFKIKHLNIRDKDKEGDVSNDGVQNNSYFSLNNKENIGNTNIQELIHNLPKKQRNKTTKFVENHSNIRKASNDSTNLITNSNNEVSDYLNDLSNQNSLNCISNNTNYNTISNDKDFHLNYIKNYLNLNSNNIIEKKKFSLNDNLNNNLNNVNDEELNNSNMLKRSSLILKKMKQSEMNLNVKENIDTKDNNNSSIFESNSKIDPNNNYNESIYSNNKNNTTSQTKQQLKQFKHNKHRSRNTSIPDIYNVVDYSSVENFNTIYQNDYIRKTNEFVDRKVKQSTPICFINQIKNNQNKYSKYNNNKCSSNYNTITIETDLSSLKNTINTNTNTNKTLSTDNNGKNLNFYNTHYNANAWRNTFNKSSSNVCLNNKNNFLNKSVIKLKKGCKGKEKSKEKDYSCINQDKQENSDSNIYYNRELTIRNCNNNMNNPNNNSNISNLYSTTNNNSNNVSKLSKQMTNSSKTTTNSIKLNKDTSKLKLSLLKQTTQSLVNNKQNKTILFSKIDYNNKGYCLFTSNTNSNSNAIINTANNNGFKTYYNNTIVDNKLQQRITTIKIPKINSKKGTTGLREFFDNKIN